MKKIWCAIAGFFMCGVAVADVDTSAVGVAENYLNSITLIDKQLFIHILKLSFLCICLFFSLNSTINKYKTLINDVIQLFKTSRKSINESR